MPVRGGLRGRLLALLLGFGVVPLAVSVLVGYGMTSRAVSGQAERALREVTGQVALHVATELDRERLLLRSIAGGLPAPPTLVRMQRLPLERSLLQGLPEQGVFDGLRLVVDGRVVAGVALRTAAPHWPAEAPATDWARRSVFIHQRSSRVLAYLVAVPVAPSSAQAWIEGHVRAEDFLRVFGLPGHLMGALEFALMDEGGNVLVVGHAHAKAPLTGAFRPWPTDTLSVRRIRLGDGPALATAARIEGSDWIVATALPTEIALAPLSLLRDFAAVAILLLLGLIVGTGAVASASVTRPLRELTAVARRFGEGGAYEPVRTSAAGEVSELVRAFDRMAADLERSRQEIARLHEAEMERAQQLATVGELASGVAHEIRNPLTGVRGAIELALGRLSPDDPSRPLLDEAELQLMRIENATTQLLRFARPPELREIVVEANALVERAVRVVEPQARYGGVQLVMEPTAAASRVRADPEPMVQVLVNLLLNAIEVTPRGGTVTLWVARHAPNAWLGVRDTGPGVPPDLRERIFRPFFTTKGKGTGLGLSISRQIVSRHRGSLWVEDTPGGGATFVVELPLVDEEGSRSG